MKRLIKNAEIIDGSGEASFTGSVLIGEDRIQAVMRGRLDAQTERTLGLTADQVVDAEGLTLMPGFIDTHTHADLMLLSDRIILPAIGQGITTLVVGQDGVSMAPLPEDKIALWRENLKNLDGDSDEIDWHYRTTEGYLKEIERHPASVNAAYLAPHGNIRLEVMGLKGRPATDREIKEMGRILERELQGGAIGLSTGLIYVPCLFAEKKELTALCRVCAEYGVPLAIHQRSEGSDLIASMREVLAIGRVSGASVHFSHFKVQGKKNQKMAGTVLDLLDEAESEGLHITFDQYPYIAGSTTLGVILPPWAFDGGHEALMARLRDPELRKRMKEDTLTGLPGWDDFYDSVGFENIRVTDLPGRKNRDLIGLSLPEIAERREKEVFEAVYDLLLEEENHVTMVDEYGSEAVLLELMARPEMNFCTDGLLWSRHPHPRAYGGAVRLLEDYTGKAGLTIEGLVRKLTSEGALSHGLAQRGLIRPGYFADLNLVDLSELHDRSTYEDPCRLPTGIRATYVNGREVMKEGHFTGQYPGRVLRR